ncbi:MAG: hypothetical protein ACLUW6_11355 [Coriobacteriaceae bacterium]
MGAGFILMAMVKLRVDPEGCRSLTAVQAYFGRWLFYVVCGLAMGLVCCVGDLPWDQRESPAASSARAAHGVRGREPHVRAGLRI